MSTFSSTSLDGRVDVIWATGTRICMNLMPVLVGSLIHEDEKVCRLIFFALSQRGVTVHLLS